MLSRVWQGIDWLAVDDRLIATALDILEREADGDE